MTIIRVDFFKPSGKWYSGGEVDVGTAKLYDDNLLDVIWENQQILAPGDKEYYTIVIDDVYTNFIREDYHEFYKAVLQVGRLLPLMEN